MHYIAQSHTMDDALEYVLHFGGCESDDDMEEYEPSPPSSPLPRRLSGSKRASEERLAEEKEIPCPTPEKAEHPAKAARVTKQEPETEKKGPSKNVDPIIDRAEEMMVAREDTKRFARQTKRVKDYLKKSGLRYNEDFQKAHKGSRYAGQASHWKDFISGILGQGDITCHLCEVVTCILHCRLKPRRAPGGGKASASWRLLVVSGEVVVDAPMEPGGGCGRLLLEHMLYLDAWGPPACLLFGGGRMFLNTLSPTIFGQLQQEVVIHILGD